MREEYIIQSVQKALEVLKLFDSKHKEMTLTEISNLSGIRKGTMIRILTTLQAQNFVDYDEKQKLYHLGIAVFQLSNNCFSFSNLISIAKSYLDEATTELRVIAHLGTISSDRIVLVDRIYPSSEFLALDLDSTIGGEIQVHCTGIGKVITAYANPELQNKLINSCSFEGYSENTITDKEEFAKNLLQIEKQGYAINSGEHEEFLECITYPIFNEQGEIFAALSFTGVVSSFTPERVEACHIALKKITSAISSKLGYKK